LPNRTTKANLTLPYLTLPYPALPCLTLSYQTKLTEFFSENGIDCREVHTDDDDLESLCKKCKSPIIKDVRDESPSQNGKNDDDVIKVKKTTKAKKVSKAKNIQSCFFCHEKFAQTYKLKLHLMTCHKSESPADKAKALKVTVVASFSKFGLS
jgi:hypothetical protein